MTTTPDGRARSAAPEMGTTPSPDVPFVRRVLIVAAIVSAIVLIAMLLWFGGEVVLLVFAGVLVAVLLRSLADWLSAHTPLSAGWALAVVVLALVAALALGVWLFSAMLIEQVQQLAGSLPQALDQLRQRIAQLPLGQAIVDQLPQPSQLLPQGTTVFTRVTGVVSGVLGSLANFVIVLVLGLYLAAAPGIYTRGLVRLVPHGHRGRAHEVLGTLGQTLRGWLLGQFGVMVLNGVLTWLGLMLIGVPQAALLGVVAGVLNFIPNLGPFLAAVPALLLALTEGPTQVLSVLALFVLIQNLEGFVLTPLVQQRTVDIPPALLLTSQVLLGVLFGFLGVLLAVPLAAVALVLVKLLYVEDTLDDPVSVPGEATAER